MDERKWSMAVCTAAVRIASTVGKPLGKAFDEYVTLAKESASDLDDPEAGWFVGDVLNAINEMEMAKD